MNGWNPFKWQMSPNSLFAVLLRSRWWVSLLVALAMFGLARLFIPAEYAIFMPMPFLIIAAIAGWQQFQAPSESRIAATLAAAREMSWETFSQAIAEGYRREGYTVEPIAGNAADFLVERAGRTAVVSCRRWKAARTGVEPLQSLQAAREKRDVHDGVYITAGEVTEQARAFAVRHQLRLPQGAELMRLIGARKV